jgi:hypothetical protein
MLTKKGESLSRPMWTERRMVGITLIIGCLLFLTAAGLTPKDQKGNYIYDLPLREGLIATFQSWSTWHWGLILFGIAVVLTLLGFAFLTTILRKAGDGVFSRIGLISFLLAVPFFLMSMAFDASIGFWAAQETVRTNLVPDLYVQLSSWSDAFFTLFTPLTFCAALAYGAAILSTRVLPHWLGWLIVIYNLAGFVLFVIAGDMPPFVHYLLPILIGITLLLPRYQQTGRSNREQALSLEHSPVFEKQEIR